jgi:hypothetical protein
MIGVAVLIVPIVVSFNAIAKLTVRKGTESEPKALRLTLRCERVGDDGTAFFSGELRNVGQLDLCIWDLAESNAIPQAIRTNDWSSNCEKDWWTMSSEGMHELSAGSYIGPDLIVLRSGEAIPVAFRYWFEPGRYYVRWAYAPSDDPRATWTERVEADLVEVVVPGEQ